MKNLLFSFCFLYLTTTIAEATMNCPDQMQVKTIWVEAGYERLSGAFNNQTTRVESTPEIYLQLNTPYANSNGEIVCDYYYVVSTPAIRINLGKPGTKKMERIEKPEKKRK